MEIIPEYVPRHKRITHYALYDDTDGIATLVPGGFIFQRTAESRVRLVRYTDPKLTLLGRCDLPIRSTPWT